MIKIVRMYSSALKVSASEFLLEVTLETAADPTKLHFILFIHIFTVLDY